MSLLQLLNDIHDINNEYDLQISENGFSKNTKIPIQALLIFIRNGASETMASISLKQ